MCFHLCSEAFKLAFEPVATGTVRLTIWYTGAKGHLLSGVVVRTISIEGGYNDRGLGLYSRFGLLASAGTPKEYTQ